MGVETKIEWCDRSASPWHGCSRVHAGCDNCYAEAMAGRNPKTLGVWGENGTRVKSKSFVANLRKWNREAEARGEPISVFPSICDPFEDRPELVEWRNEMFATIDECPWIRLLLLTKRPQNVRRMWPHEGFYRRVFQSSPYGVQDCDPTPKRLNNVCLLTSVSDQATAEAMIHPLLECRDLVPVLGVSAEPLLGSIDLSARLGLLTYSRDAVVRMMPHGLMYPDPRAGKTVKTYPSQLDWVIVGGESGPKARPCDIGWVRSIVTQCKAAGVPCFVKQLGANPHYTNHQGDMHACGPFRDPKGGDWNEWPEDLRVREWPEVAHA